MSVVSRSALESSSLADLHEIASELGLDGYRRLRKANLVDAIIERQGGEDETAVNGDAPAVEVEAETETETDRPARRSRRGGRGRSRARDRDPRDGDTDDRDESDEDEAPRAPRRARSSRSGRGGRDDDAVEDRVASGTVELLSNGSGFLRVSPPDPSDDDVYISAAQVGRCGLV